MSGLRLLNSVLPVPGSSAEVVTGPPSTVGPEPPKASSKKLSTGAIVGIVFGVLAGVGLVVCVWFFLCRRRSGRGGGLFRGKKETAAEVRARRAGSVVKLDVREPEPIESSQTPNYLCVDSYVQHGTPESMAASTLSHQYLSRLNSKSVHSARGHCAQCGYISTMAEEDHCFKCQTPLRPMMDDIVSPENAAKTSIMISGNTIFCNKCGASTKEDQRYCHVCETPLSSIYYAEQQRTSPKAPEPASLASPLYEDSYVSSVFPDQSLAETSYIESHYTGSSYYDNNSLDPIDGRFTGYGSATNRDTLDKRDKEEYRRSRESGRDSARKSEERASLQSIEERESEVRSSQRSNEGESNQSPGSERGTLEPSSSLEETDRQSGKESMRETTASHASERDTMGQDSLSGGRETMSSIVSPRKSSEERVTQPRESAGSASREGK